MRRGVAAARLIVPKSLRDLLKPEWKRNLILEDPRTSAPGLAFVLYAGTRGGGEGFWKSLRGPSTAISWKEML